MSRTYRLRHYPKFGMRMWGSNQLTPPPHYYTDGDMTEVSEVYPPCCHPWVGHGLAAVPSSIRRWQRKLGDKAARRATLAILKHPTSHTDDFTGPMPLRKHYIDPWSID